MICSLTTRLQNHRSGHRYLPQQRLLLDTADAFCNGPQQPARHVSLHLCRKVISFGDAWNQLPTQFYFFDLRILCFILFVIFECIVLTCTKQARPPVLACAPCTNACLLILLWAQYLLSGLYYAFVLSHHAVTQPLSCTPHHNCLNKQV